MTRCLTAVCFFSLLALGCGKSQLDGKPTAKVEPVSSSQASATKGAPAESVKADLSATKPTEAPAATPGAAKPPVAAEAVKSEPSASAKRPAVPPLVEPDPDAIRELVLDVRRSTVKFVGRKMTKDHEGTFEEIAGKAKLRGFMPLEFKVGIQTRSVATDHPDLTNHLKGADFFNTAKYPSARFTSTKVRPGGEGTATHTITGELSMLAVTKRITFPATIVVTDAGATGLAEFKINRKDFGIVYPGRPDDLISDEVLLKLNLAYLDKKYVR